MALIKSQSHHLIRIYLPVIKPFRKGLTQLWMLHPTHAEKIAEKGSWMLRILSYEI
jgi:hypothetical protein